MIGATHIRRLFLEPEEAYSIPDAAEMLGMDLEDIRGWMDVGELEAIPTFSGPMLPWGELASFGIDHWSQEVIEEALGADLADAIPELLRLADLEVRIPRLEILALERIAERDGKSVDAVLARELLDFVSAHSDFLAKSIRGFKAALRWPQ
jgi:CO/xanthine dehydrogenase Mo-binding subunit